MIPSKLHQNIFIEFLNSLKFLKYYDNENVNNENELS